MKKIFSVFILVFSLITGNAQTAPNMGSAASFALLANDSIIASDTMSAWGNAGAGNFIDPDLIATNKYTGGSIVTNAQAAVANAKSSCSSQPGTSIPGTLNGQSLPSGVYSVTGNAMLSDTLTLNGDTNSIFIFNITGDLNISAGAVFITISNIRAKNIYWNVGGAVTVSGGQLIGVILSTADVNVAGVFGGEIAIYSSGTVHLPSVQRDAVSGFGFKLSSHENLDLKTPGLNGWPCPGPFDFTCDLVTNPSLETTDICPDEGELYHACDWGDYEDWDHNYLFVNHCEMFADCNDAMGIPQYGILNNCFGSLAPHTGDNYAGFGAYQRYIGSGSNYNWLTKTLNVPLTSGKTYLLEYWIALSNNSNRATPIETYITVPQDALDSGVDAILYSTAPLVYITSGALTSTSWTRVAACYTPTTSTDQTIVIKAGGSYPFTTVTPSNPSPLGCSGMPSEMAYYFVDDVTLRPMADAGSDVTTCDYSATIGVSCPATPGVTYSWTSSGPAPVSYSPSSNSPNPTVNFSLAGTYTFTVTATYGSCTATDVTVVSISAITATASASPSAIAPGGSSNLSLSVSGGSGYTYNWAPSASLSSASIANPVASPGATTTYTVTITNAQGCITTASTTVSVLPPACFNTLDYDIPDGAYASVFFSGITSLSAVTVRVNGLFTIDVPSFTFSGCNVIMESTARINIPANRALYLVNRTHIFSCTEMWDGIYVFNGGALHSQAETLIEDGLQAVNVEQGGVAYLTDNIFNKNHTSVRVTGNTLATTPVNITGSVFTSRDIPTASSPVMNPSIGTVRSNLLLGVPGYASSNMRAPFSSFKSIYGIFAYDVATLSVGYGAEQNIFDNQGCGISIEHSSVTMTSNSVIKNNRFQHMINSHPCLPSPCTEYLGVGIKAKGNLTGNNRIRIGGPLTNESNMFMNIHTAISITSNTIVRVSDNTIDNTSTIPVGSITGIGRSGILVRPSDNNDIDVSSNRVNNCVNGIWINRNTAGSINSVSTLIDYNMVSANASGYCTNGITVSDLVNSGSTTPVDKIKVRNSTVIDAHTCITATNVKNGLAIYDNPLLSTRYGGATAGNGIRLQNCNAVKIHNNTNIIASPSAASNTNYKGINIITSPNCSVTCNAISGFGESMAFSNSCVNSYIRNNAMSDAARGFVLRNSGQVGTQGNSTEPCGLWWNLANVVIHTYADATLTANTNSILYVNNSMAPTGFTGIPTTNMAGTGSFAYSVGLGGINVATGLPIDCGSVVIALVGGGGGGSYSMDAMEVNTLATDSTSYVYFEDATKYRNKKYAYKAIEADPSLMSGDTILQDFHDSTEVQSLGKLTDVDNSIESNNAYLAGITNAGVVINNIVEDNQKSFNDLFLLLMNDPDYIYSSVEMDELNYLANQCAIEGGDAVWQARVLLWTIANTIIEFEDICDGTQRALTPITHQGEHAPTRFSVFPNPNDGNMSVIYSMKPADTGILSLVDIAGKEISRFVLDPKNNKLELRSLELKDGVYFYNIILNNKLEKTEKLVIIR